MTHEPQANASKAAKEATCANTKQLKPSSSSVDEDEVQASEESVTLSSNAQPLSILLFA